MTATTRLDKRLAQMLPCSRREAELYIAGGWVRVDGEVVDEPQHRVSDTQRVELDPQAKAEPQEPVTLLMNLPATADPATATQLVTPASHAADDGTRRVLKSHFARLSQALPLQEGAGGLAVFTQDWRVLRKLADSDYPVEQEYIVDVAGTPVPDGMERLQHGHHPAKVSWQSENRLRFALKAPKPGQIRAMCEQLGLQVIAMKRIRIGRLPMAKLSSGQWRYLAPHERF